MTNETKGKIIQGLTEYSGFRKGVVSVSNNGPDSFGFWGRDSAGESQCKGVFHLMELITNPEWAKGVWPRKGVMRKIRGTGPKELPCRPEFFERVTELVCLHLEGKDNEVWDRLKERWEEVR